MAVLGVACESAIGMNELEQIIIIINLQRMFTELTNELNKHIIIDNIHQKRCSKDLPTL